MVGHYLDFDKTASYQMQGQFKEGSNDDGYDRAISKGSNAGDEVINEEVGDGFRSNSLEDEGSTGVDIESEKDEYHLRRKRKRPAQQIEE